MDDEDTADAFALLGSDVRVGVLRALAEAERSHGDAVGAYDVGFATLYDAVDVDSSSAFAYHLDKLEGVFVEHTDDGYRLTDRGQRVVRAILAGTYTERVDFGPATLDGYCPFCEGTTLQATHAEDRLVISCRDCERQLVSEELTAGQVANRTDDEVLASVAVRVRSDLEQAVDGVCGACGGRVDPTIDAVRIPAASDDGDDDRVDADESSETRYLFRGDCLACHRRVNAPVECCLFAHPAVAGFYWNHGILLRDEPIWAALRRLDGDEWSVQQTYDEAEEGADGEQGAGFVCQIVLDGDELHLDVDPDLTVRRARTAETVTNDETSQDAD